MKLAELIEYLVNPEKLAGLVKQQKLNEESEALLIYMHGSLDLDADIVFFAIEETEDCLEFEKNGMRYVQLFPIDHAIDLINVDLQLKKKRFSNLQIAERLLNYRLNDA